jgi:hypothetical protein
VTLLYNQRVLRFFESGILFSPDHLLSLQEQLRLMSYGDEVPVVENRLGSEVEI